MCTGPSCAWSRASMAPHVVPILMPGHWPYIFPYLPGINQVCDMPGKATPIAWGRFCRERDSREPWAAKAQSSCGGYLTEALSSSEAPWARVYLKIVSDLIQSLFLSFSHKRSSQPLVQESCCSSFTETPLHAGLWIWFPAKVAILSLIPGQSKNYFQFSPRKVISLFLQSFLVKRQSLCELWSISANRDKK